MNEAIFARLAQLLREAADNPSVVAVILTGSGGYFTSGADVKEMASVDPGTGRQLTLDSFCLFAISLFHTRTTVLQTVRFHSKCLRSLFQYDF